MMLQIPVFLVELTMMMFLVLSSLFVFSVLAQIVLALVFLLMLSLQHAVDGEGILRVIWR